MLPISPNNSHLGVVSGATATCCHPFLLPLKCFACLPHIAPTALLPLCTGGFTLSLATDLSSFGCFVLPLSARVADNHAAGTLGFCTFTDSILIRHRSLTTHLRLTWLATDEWTPLPSMLSVGAYLTTLFSVVTLSIA
jgi:hypothetical protein